MVKALLFEHWIQPDEITTGVYTIVVSISLAILFSKRSQIPVSVKSSTAIAISFLFALSSVYILLDIINGFQSLVSS